MDLQVCVNGARSVSEHPRLSSDASEVAEEAAAAVDAGAGSVHLHPKDADGTDTLDEDCVAHWVREVRRRCPGVPVGVTTGAWIAPDVDRRVAAIAAWSTMPDFASVNWHEQGAEAVAAVLLEHGVGIEAGIWHLDGLRAWQRSALRSQCLRVLIELPDIGDVDAVRQHAESLVTGVRRVAPGSSILLHGEERSTWPAIDLAVEAELPTRIGLEDTLTLPDGTPASGNAQLVEEVVRCFGRRAR
ncbi:hypothetical protein HJ588_09005 [Flexivirga sp. ID2601S]|uniref:3-keto-5-aminohexanoate cleavage protein n=1 Tax=Flexivirga aerilata TaxID=1656889 RepID=A0A849AEY2_9MICO|nr:3-keto-5-aminohexanoate cleavage protein [Flexivirga aerilata]NNG39414.1 hypothetical protein [Flexivirga aerilata]